MVQKRAACPSPRRQMGFFSRTRESYTGSYLAQRRRMRITAILSLFSAVFLIAAVGLKITRSGYFKASVAARAVSKKTILSDWNSKRWDEVIAASITSLAAKPLDPFYLSMKGLAAFYKVAELPEGEERAALLAESISALRKALALGGRFPKAQAKYVLGKAYFQKGAYYYDEAAKYMESSIGDGFEADDSREYLALAYSGLGDKGKAIANFEAALRKSRAELLFLAAAKAYLDAGDSAKAETLLEEALASSKDALVAEKCRFLLGDIFLSRGDAKKAQVVYETILERNPGSAEAHYRLGLLFQGTGDPVRARAEWRKAVSIDPMHAGSRQKLSEKL
jgi:tetratricopeptide (TPR) repeat protein